MHRLQQTQSKSKQHKTQLQSWPAAKLPCYTQPSSTKSSCNITLLPLIQQYHLQQSTISCCLIYKGLQANILLVHALAVQAHALGGQNVEDYFFDPRGITSLPSHATLTYYWFFWLNIFKIQNKLISHSTTWIGLTWPARSLLQEGDSWSTVPLHQLGL